MPALTLAPLRRTAADAAKFAKIVHDGQTDKAGRPYVEHLARVAAGTLNLLRGCPFLADWQRDEAAQIAWLHDVVEDTAHDDARLYDEGFHRRVVAGVMNVTKPAGCLRYNDWIQHIGAISGVEVILVKLADVTDNADPGRLAFLPEADRERLTRKYAGAKEALEAAARARGWRG